MPQEHPCYQDQHAAIAWAKAVLARKQSFVILDTETTGLGDDAEIIQLAIIDLDAKTLFNENMRPTELTLIPSEATAVHGLTMAALEGCPTFAELAEPLGAAIGERDIITYNAAFDSRMYRQTLALAGGFEPSGVWTCAMLEYARFVGEWNDYRQSYRWHKLQGGDHTALGDCLATLALIQSMAEAPMAAP